VCDTVCVRLPDGMLFAKSSDRPVDEVQVLRWLGRRAPSDEPVRATHVTVPDAGAAALLGSQPTWMWGLEHGVNEHGVAIGNEKVWTVDDPHAAPPGLLGMDLVRLGLERGTTAEGALDAVVALLEAHGQGGTGEEGRDEPYWSSFLVVDGRGGWVLETSSRSWVAQPVGDGAAISNRLTVSTGWARSSPDVAPGADWDERRAPDAPTGIADHRLAATRACVARGALLTPAEAVAMLRDHGTGPWGAPGGPADAAPPPPPDDVGADWSGVTVCMHVRGYQCTTASMVADLPAADDAPTRVWASLGTPCTAIFLPVAVFGGPSRRGDGPADLAVGPGAVVPDVLGDAEAWRSFAALSRRVEASGDQGSAALAATRGVLAPVEAAAWDEADALWAAGAPPEAWRAAAAGWDGAVRGALDSLM
jgi:secernin